MPARSAASGNGRRVPGASVCAPWRSAWISLALSSSARPSSAAPYSAPLPLLVGPPSVGAPAADGAGAPRHGVPGLEAGVATVGQAHDGGPVGPSRRLLCRRLSCVGLGSHPRLVSSPGPPRRHRHSGPSKSSILYISLLLYHRKGVGRGQADFRETHAPEVRRMALLGHASRLQTP